MRSWRGTTLVETVIALFLLGFSTLLVASLFQSGLQRARLVETESIAVNVAENSLADLRAWSKQGKFDSVLALNVVDGSKYSDPSHPGFEVTYKVRPAKLASSCSSIENSRPLDQRRSLESSVAFVAAEVKWTTSAGPRSLTLETLIPESFRELRSLELKGLPSVLARDESVTVSAVVTDTNGKEVKDLFINWWLEPIDGRGTLVAHRAKPEATLTHQVDNGWGTKLHLGGRCRIAAKAIYGGQEVIGYSDEIELTP